MIQPKKRVYIEYNKLIPQHQKAAFALRNEVRKTRDLSRQKRVVPVYLPAAVKNAGWTFSFPAFNSYYERTNK